MPRGTLLPCCVAAALPAAGLCVPALPLELKLDVVVGVVVVPVGV